MIVNLLLDILKSLLDWLFASLPSISVTLPSGWQAVIDFLLGLNDLLPVVEVMQCVGIYMLIVGGTVGIKWLIKLIDWIADVIP